MEYWNSWESGLGQIVEDNQVDEELRNKALDVRNQMRSIQNGP